MSIVKAQQGKRKKDTQPKGERYLTPRSLVWLAKDVILSEFDKTLPVLEPCSGTGVLVDEMVKMGFLVVENDLYNEDGQDYLLPGVLSGFKQVFTNPPFSAWDGFVMKARSHADKWIFIGRLNYLGTHVRNVNGTWDNLKAIYLFDRYVDYQTPEREDGLFHVGATVTGWFVWDKAYTGAPTLHIIDVQRYAKLGNFNPRSKE